MGKLDYALSQQERLQAIEELMKDDYWMRFFDDYYKVGITHNDGLSHLIPACANLEKLANYILYSPDGERITKKTKYNFYQDEKKFMNIETNIEGMSVNKEGNSLDNGENVIDFLVNTSDNYKMECKQRITAKDTKREFIEDYHDMNSNLTKLLKDEDFKYVKQEIKKKLSSVIAIIKKQPADFEKKLKLSKLYYIRSKLDLYISYWIKANKEDMINIKDSIDGTIYFKNINNYFYESTPYGVLERFDFFDKEHVKRLLCVPIQKDGISTLNPEVQILVTDLQKYILKCEFDTFKLQLIELLRKDLILEEIADILGTSRQNMQFHYNTIINQIIKQYEMEYEDWYYLNICKGKYKRCSKCGEIKLVQRFSPDQRNKDGLHSVCKECRNN